MSTPGERNNNPGNLRVTKDKWQGLDEPRSDGTFFRFKDPVWGIRAIAVLLINYQDKYGCKTITQIMQRYAPEHENPTRMYTDWVAKSLIHLGIYNPASSEVNLHHYEHARPIVEAIIRFENGWTGKNASKMPYSSAQIDEGLRRAGVVPAAREKAPSSVAIAVKEVAKTPQGKAAGILAALELTKQGVAQIAEIWDGLGQFHLNPHWVLTIGGLIAAGVVIWMVWDKVQDQKAGRA